MRIIDKDNLPGITPIGALTGAGSFGTLTRATQTFAINSSSGEGVVTADVTLNNGNLTLAINNKAMDTKLVTHSLFWDQHLVVQTEQII